MPIYQTISAHFMSGKNFCNFICHQWFGAGTSHLIVESKVRERRSKCDSSIVLWHKRHRHMNEKGIQTLVCKELLPLGNR